MMFRFQSKELPDVLMLSDLTERIFKIVGKSFEPKGIFLVEQLEDAIEKLEVAIKYDADLANQSQKSIVEEETYAPNEIGRLGQRAYPFLELLKKARDTNNEITWGT